MWRYIPTEELYHHGVQGQRWGIRRYQNPDGSLTPAGRRRAQKLASKYAEITGKKIVVKKDTVKTSSTKKKSTDKEEPKKENIVKKKINETKNKIVENNAKKKAVKEKEKQIEERNKEAVQRSEQEKKKNVKSMSDQELIRKINRHDLEVSYKRAMDAEASMGKKFVKTFAKQVLKPAAIDAGKNVMTNLLTKLGNKAVNEITKKKPTEYDKLKQQANELKLKRQIKDDTNYLNKKTKEQQLQSARQDLWKQIDKYKGNADAISAAMKQFQTQYNSIQNQKEDNTKYYWQYQQNNNKKKNKNRR